MPGLIQHRPEHKVPPGAARSGKWRSVRAAHLKKHPRCALCGGKKKLEAHHCLPFHLDPSLELDPNNLITLCEEKKDGANCHLLCGHLGSFHSFNKDVREDARTWNIKLMHRPKG